MRKLNEFAFTLIELLAVITIMGILMLVAIPAVGKIIDNVRKDMFIDTAKQYVNGVKNLWISASLECSTGGTVSKKLSTDLGIGEYYVHIDTKKTGQSGKKDVYTYRKDCSKGGNTVCAFSDVTINGYAFCGTKNMTFYYPALLESGGKSPWGDKDVEGFVSIYVGKKNTTFDIFLTDHTHTIKSKNGYTSLKRSDIVDYNIEDFRYDTTKWCYKV